MNDRQSAKPQNFGHPSGAPVMRMETDVTQQEARLTADLAAQLAADIAANPPVVGDSDTTVIQNPRRVVMPKGRVGERFAKHIRRAQIMAYHDSESKSTRAILSAGVVVHALLHRVDHRTRGQVGKLLKVGKLFSAAVLLQTKVGAK